MTPNATLVKTKKTRFASRSMFYPARLSLSLGLFLLALLPRAYDLQRFVTADEAKWVYRSAQFLAALLRGDFPATSVNLTPAVTTTWLGSLGLTCYYQLNRAAINRPFAEWLISLPEFRVELEVLSAARWPMVILTSLSVVVIYLLLCRLFNPSLAFLAAAFVALDPHLLALSRVIGHDAPAAVFMTISLLLLFLSVKLAGKQRSNGAGETTSSLLRPPALLLPIIFSGVAAGLAFLSKAPALFLIPFAGLVLFFSETHFLGPSPRLLNSALPRFLMWLVVAYLTFVVIWPAAWVDPVGQPAAVFQNAFLSATDQEEAEEEGYWRVPDLGPFYYIVNGAFKLSPLVMAGAGLAIVFLASRRGSESTDGEAVNGENRSPLHSPLLWLLAFTLLFTLFMTASDKRSARYILPIFPPLAIMAASGWLQLYQVAGSRGAGKNVSRISAKPPLGTHHASAHRGPSALQSLPLALGTERFASPVGTFRGVGRLLFITLLTLCAFIILLPYSPYYFTYFNPLLGGPYTAPYLVKIGWGEGLDRAGRFLQREDNLRGSRVGTAYASTVAPFFEGSLAGVTSANLDYVVLYLKQVQSGQPSPAFIRYFEQLDPLFSVELNGIHYADVYPGSALQSTTADRRPLTADFYPVGFRPLTPYARMGESLEVDVVWQAAKSLPLPSAVVTLVAASSDANDGGEGPAATTPILAQAEGQLTYLDGNLLVSRHRLLLPANLSRGPYSLLADNYPLGEVELRNFQIPADLGKVDGVIFGQQPTLTVNPGESESHEQSFLEQLAIAAYQFEPATDYLGVTIAWQAQASNLPDYTVFVQILTAETNERLAGVDTPPLKGTWPTSRWVKDEVVVDTYLVAIPPGFPPGFYKVIIGLYHSETGQRLTLGNGQDHWFLPWTFIRK